MPMLFSIVVMRCGMGWMETREEKRRVNRQRKYGRLKGVLTDEHVVTNLQVLYTTDFMV